jgi:hypothetical protein
MDFPSSNYLQAAIWVGTLQIGGWRSANPFTRWIK